MRILTNNYPIEQIPTNVPRVSEAGLARFRAARYGMSVHWGLYSLLRSGEWVMYQQRIPNADYRPLMARFNPTRFDAEEWADLLVESGQQFFVITTKHHDGFCLWDTELTDFKVTNSAYRQDLLAALAPALHERGIGLHFYYSLVDWTHPAYRNDWPAYVAYYQGQLRELLTQYGPIAGVEFDGYWPRVEFEGDDELRYFAPHGAWQLVETYTLIHTLQPDAVVINNSHILPQPGEDCQIWELDLPGENTIGFNTTEVGDRLKVAWWNLNSGWAYLPKTHRVKSADTIIQTMRDVYARDAVFVLNVGPRAAGDIHPDEQRVLREIGQYWQTHQVENAQDSQPLGLDAAV